MELSQKGLEEEVEGGEELVSGYRLTTQRGRVREWTVSNEVSFTHRGDMVEGGGYGDPARR
jgi:hypothetical protein